jgi:hypothetical protein
MYSNFRIGVQSGSIFTIVLLNRKIFLHVLSTMERNLSFIYKHKREVKIKEYFCLSCMGEQSILYHIILQVYYESQIMFGCICFNIIYFVVCEQN